MPFSKKGLKSMPLEQALKDAAASRFVRQATCMEHPEMLVQIGKDVFKQEAYLWVPNGNASDCSDTRAAWVGCSNGNFYIIADGDLDVVSAVRGVSRSEPVRRAVVSEKGITMIYKIRTELEQGIALLAEAEEALKKGSLDAGKLSRLEQLSAPTDAMVILRRQAAYRKGLKMFSEGWKIIGQGILCVQSLLSLILQQIPFCFRALASLTLTGTLLSIMISCA